MRVNHRCLHVLVAQELLDGTNVVATLQEMRADEVAYLVGTPRHLLSKLEKDLIDKPWEQVHEGRAVKLLEQEDEHEQALQLQEQAPWHLCLGETRLPLGQRTLVMGILNVTPDSFSDGGLYLQPEQAVKHAEGMLAEGADIIDVGGQSSRPGAAPVAEEVEFQRVIPVVRDIVQRYGALVSVDTYRASVAEAALDAWSGRGNCSTTDSRRCDGRRRRAPSARRRVRGAADRVPES